jgi:hypothetical protein
MSYLYENELPDEIKIQLGLAKYKDPEILSKLSPDEAGAIIKKQQEAIVAHLFSKNIRSNLVDPSNYANKPAPTTIEETDPVQAQQEAYYYAVENRLNNSNFMQQLVEPITGRTTGFTKPDIQLLKKDIGPEFEFASIEGQPDIIEVKNLETNKTVTFNINDSIEQIKGKILVASKGPRIKYLVFNPQNSARNFN